MLSEKLRNLAQLSDGSEREKKIGDVKALINKHKEKRILELCLNAATEGKTSVSLGKNVIPPKSLYCEGFKFIISNGKIICQF